MTPARVLYSAAIVAATPLFAAHLWSRGRRQPAYRAHWRERWALYGPQDLPPAAEASAGTLWLHAVSLGETRAAAPLVDALRGRWPRHRLLLTQTTPTGRDAAHELADAATSVAYLPYDYPYAVRRFLDRSRPSVGLLMETELWPNLLVEARARGVPVALVNGRLSQRSFERMRRAGALVRETTGALAVAAMQTEADAARMQALGAARVAVTGNLKFDIDPPAALLARGRGWRAGFARPRVLVAASTRDGEEALLLGALAARPDAGRLLVLVPRHPQRFDEVGRLAGEAGLRVARRSATERPGTDVDVWLGDSMGELPAYYAAGDVAFVGGSLLPHGGQNLIEACACGVPVLLGEHTFNFAQAAEQAVGAGAARRVPDAAALVAAADAWLQDAPARRAAAAAAVAFAAAHRGATARTVALIAPLIGPAGA